MNQKKSSKGTAFHADIQMYRGWKIAISPIAFQVIMCWGFGQLVAEMQNKELKKSKGIKQEQTWTLPIGYEFQIVVFFYMRVAWIFLCFGTILQVAIKKLMWREIGREEINKKSDVVQTTVWIKDVCSDSNIEIDYI